jgi:hypothetical protein
MHNWARKWLPILLLWAMWFTMLIVGVACDRHPAAKRPPKSAFPVQIPMNCVTGGYANRSYCTAIEGSSDLALCKEIILKYVCIKVASGPKAEEVKVEKKDCNTCTTNSDGTQTCTAAYCMSPDSVRDSVTK